jgi:hypothetical protein
MAFDQHLFISYAHIDNQPLTSEEQGWISRFHKSLESALSMRLGAPAKIWRDEKLRGNDVFAEEIVDQFPRTALLVSVLTPRYVNSEWCTREVREFCESAAHTGGVVVENKARIFKVIKTPVETEAALPEVMKNVLGYEFFIVEDGAPLELDPAYGEKFAQDYNRKIVKLGWDVAQLLKKLATDNRGGAPAPTIPATAKPTVYLAECSYDRREAREMLEGDLRLHGYTVLPDQTLPREEAEYVAVVERLLARCALSIHLVGESYGAVPDGPSQKSLVVLQNEMAVRRSKNAALPRVIWLRDGLSSPHPQQQAFIAALHQDAEAQYGADLITGDLEECKAAIHAALKKLEKPTPAKPAEQVTADGGLIYLLCEEKDRKATVPLRKFFRGHGFVVETPVFAGDATAVREANQKLLVTCDAILLFYGAGDEAWKHTMDNELRKMPGYRGGKPLLARYTYLADPKTSDKEDLLDMDEPHLITGFGNFADTALAEFIQALRPSGVAS